MKGVVYDQQNKKGISVNGYPEYKTNNPRDIISKKSQRGKSNNEN